MSYNFFVDLKLNKILLLPLLACLLLLGGCVATAVGVVVGTTVAVGAAVVKVPVKAGGAVIDVMSDDEDEDKSKK